MKKQVPGHTFLFRESCKECFIFWKIKIVKEFIYLTLIESGLDI
jgi:hypothetical protein